MTVAEVVRTMEIINKNCNLDFDREAKIQKICTLGPDSTSSHCSVKYLLERMPRFYKEEIKVELYDSFNDIHFSAKKGDLIVVPSAFTGIHHFFMNDRYSLFGAYRYDTPPYHLAWVGEKPEKNLVIASHISPSELIPSFLGHNDFKLDTYDSTVQAAQAVLDGRASMSLSNYETISNKKMSFSKESRVIRMVWNVFGYKG